MAREVPPGTTPLDVFLQSGLSGPVSAPLLGMMKFPLSSNIRKAEALKQLKDLYPQMISGPADLRSILSQRARIGAVEGGHARPIPDVQLARIRGQNSDAAAPGYEFIHGSLYRPNELKQLQNRMDPNKPASVSELRDLLLILRGFPRAGFGHK